MRGLKFFVLCCLLACGASGCAKRIHYSVTDYPSYWPTDPSERYKSMVVVPAQTDMSLVRVNFDKELLGSLYNIDSLYITDHTQQRVHWNDERYLEKEQASQTAELMLINTLETYESDFWTTEEKEEYKVPIYKVDEYGNYLYDEHGQKIVDYYETRYKYHTVEHVDGTTVMNARVYHVPTGKRLYNNSIKGYCHYYDYAPLQRSEREALACSVDDAASTVALYVVPYHDVVHSDLDEVFTFLRADDDGSLYEDDDFEITDEQVYAQIRLSGKANLNNFSLDVLTPEGELIAEYPFMWRSSKEELTIGFPVQELIAKSPNGLNFIMRLTGRSDVIFEEEFEIDY